MENVEVFLPRDQGLLGNRYAESVLGNAILDVKTHLTEFATSKHFFKQTRLAFGNPTDPGKLRDLRHQWGSEDFRDFPTIQLQADADLRGALSAFSATTNTIYISREYVEQAASESDAITGLLLEEVGHFVDATINEVDAPGDEGAIFTALVQGVQLSQARLQSLKMEDDSTTLVLDGRRLQVEQSVPEVGNGLRGEYYDNANLTNLRMVRTDSAVNFNWGTGSPDGAIAPNTFSVRWTGQVQPTTSGSYTFFVQADDGVRLWVNGVRIINDWEDYGTVRERQGTRSLIAGQKYDIRLEYFEDVNRASVALLWSGPGVTKQVIPQSQLFSQPLSPPADSTPPTASMAATNLTTASTAPYQFTVTYTDHIAINTATLNGTDILVTGPNGFSQLATLVSVNNSTNGTPRTATYQINAPGGSWDAADNGTYTALLQANQVSDTSGNVIPATTLGNFSVAVPLPPPDLTPPTASLTAANLTTVNANPYQFTVTYSDNTAMNIATLDGSDILVTGPNGFSQLAALVRVDNTANGTPRTATYQINPPGGTWDAPDNGTYTFWLQPNQVSDTRGNFVPALSLGSILMNLAAIPGDRENIVFPSDAGVVNVRDWGARGDGVTDDTAAIQAALDAYPNGNRIIYLPNGVYRISDTLTWPEGTPSNEYKRTILQGQSEAGVILKLVNNALEFQDADEPRPVIFTGPAPAQRFGNSIRNLTVDTGVGNPGAVGVQFNASNQGSMRHVTIQSGDGQGVNGLDMDFADEIGPLLVKDVTIKGFQYGIVTGYTVNSQTFENIHLENQSVYGFWNYSQVVSIRNLTSRNTVPAIYNGVGEHSHMTLIDSSLNGLGNATTVPAIINGGTLLARNIATSGYEQAIEGGDTDVTGSFVSEFVSSPVISQFPSPLQTLGLPIQDTPDVPWDDPTTTPWANVVSYGAIPNDGVDDTAAIQAAIDSGRTTVYFPVGNYDIRSTVFVRNNVRRLIGTEAYVEVSATANLAFKIVDGTHPVVVFERIHSGYESTPTLENASSRTLVIRDASNVSGNMTGPGDVFIENVVSNPFSAWTFNGQNVWARQFNVENTGTHITNNGGNLWILGLKTERGGTLIDTRNGGRTELLGGLAYTTTAGPDGTQNAPMFINHESSISISLAEVKYNESVPNYTIYVQDVRGGVTQNLVGSQLPNYWGAGRDIPLYVGYQNRSE